MIETLWQILIWVAPVHAGVWLLGVVIIVAGGIKEGLSFRHPVRALVAVVFWPVILPIEYFALKKPTENDL